ncbi:MAG: DUF4160 domain-containing protein [Nitrospira sp.]|nr:DUF4160 domain-containing protein [Nitrospira sp.]
MPTVKNIEGPYRVFFYSFDCHEPKHVHILKRKVNVQVLVGTDCLEQEQRVFSKRTHCHSTTY